MNLSLTVYVADEKLRKAAWNLVEVTRSMTGDSSTQVNVEVDTLARHGSGSYGSVNFPTRTANYPNNIMYTNATVGTTTTTAASSNSSFHIQTPATQTAPIWSTQSYSTPISAGSPMTPDQVPSSDLFEQMLMASIKQLNEAYNLGRVHGFIEGKKKGGDEVKEGLDAALNHDPLTYAEDPFPDAATSSPSV